VVDELKGETKNGKCGSCGKAISALATKYAISVFGYVRYKRNIDKISVKSLRSTINIFLRFFKEINK